MSFRHFIHSNNLAQVRNRPSPRFVTGIRSTMARPSGLFPRTASFCLALLLASLASGAERPQPPPYKEVFDLVRTNATGLNDAQFNRAAVEGLLARLGNRAWLVDSHQTRDDDTNTTTLAATAVFDDNYGYFRIGRVGGDLADRFSAALRQLTATNKLKGVCIDLRFASGPDYAVAAGVADNFVPSEQKLFEWSGGVAKSHDKTNAFREPVAVLINHYTAGAAEALAAVLRDTDVALLIGTNTAGQASTTKDFKLSNGQVLRVATAPMKLAGGDEVNSLKPDIEVDVPPEDERAFFVNAYRVLPRAGLETNSSPTASLSVTNRLHRPRINEAELVRMSREGIDPEEEATNAARTAIPSRPVVTDPALARAIDLLKALAVVRRTRF